jgi:acyl-CoA thioesterase YciA
MTTNDAPQGELVLRTLAMPADTNANGDIFGGWLMSQMDMGGAILAKEIAHGRVVTVRVDGMTFLRPVAVGDVVCCYARCVKRGNSSISINIEVWVKKVSSEPIGQRYKATEALFIYVAVDSQGNPPATCNLMPVKKSLHTEAFFIPFSPRRSGGTQYSQSIRCPVYPVRNATDAWRFSLHVQTCLKAAQIRFRCYQGGHLA